MSCASFIGVVALVCLWYKLNCKLAVLSTALSLTVNKASAFELREEFVVKTTTVPTDDVLDSFYTLSAQVRVLDFVTVLIALFFIIAVAIFYWIVAQEALGRRSYLYLEIMSPTRCIQIRFAKLPDAS